jgi:hypothetical protein
MPFLRLFPFKALWSCIARWSTLRFHASINLPMRYRVVCGPLPRIDSYQAPGSILLLNVLTTASRLVSSIAMMIHSWLYATRMCRGRGLRAESDALHHQQAGREGY